MRTLMEKRRPRSRWSCRPPEARSSVRQDFCRPHRAGRTQGLRRGWRGGIEKHAGFVVNTGGASADDVKKTIAMVQSRVWEASGVQLEPEVRIW